MPNLTAEEWERIIEHKGLKANSQQKVFVGKEATIVSGACTGIAGTCIYANSIANSVIIKADKDTYIAVTFENIAQA